MVRVIDKSHINKNSLGTIGPWTNTLRMAGINTGMGCPEGTMHLERQLAG